MKIMAQVFYFLVLFFSLNFFGCSNGPIFHQPGSELDHIYSKIFLTDYNTAWQATLDALKRYDKTTQNRQGGIIQTVWIDNTAEKNFIDIFGGDAVYLKAKFRLNVSLAPMNLKGRSTVKVSILRDQLIQRDPLEGWKQVRSDAILENSTLYRVSRIIQIKLKLKQMEEQKMQEVMEKGVN